MEILRNGVEWQRWISFLLLACAVIAYRKLGAKDFPGYTRQFISKIDHDCRDFKGVLNRCHVWKDLGFCFKYRREMQHVCNRTCQYCVPGQKQWQVIDRAWGRVKEAARQPNSAHALVSPTLHKGPAIQILGKERAPQVDDAAIAIATQLENGIDHDVTGSPNVLGRLPNLHIKKATENDETKGKLFTSQSVPSTELDHNEKAQSINSPASISGKTQVSETRTEDSPVVVLMGYELGKTTRKKVHEVLKNSESDQLSDAGSINTVGVFVNDRLTLRGNKTSNVKNGTERTTAEKITTDNISPDSNLAKIAELLDNTTTASKHLHDKQHVHEGSGLQKVFANDRSALRENGTSDVKNGAERTTAEKITTDNISPDSNLEQIAELLENAATARRHLHDKQHVHEGKKENNADANTLQSKMHAADLDNQTMGALKNKSAQHEKLSRRQGEAILPVSSDDIINQLAFHDQRMTTSSSHSPDYNNSNMHVPPDTSMVNDSSKRNSSEDTQPIDLSKTMAGNKYQKINDSSLQMNAPLRKPVLSDSPEKQVTLTVKPGTGEAIFKMQTSPHASYTTESIPGELPSPNYFLGNEEDRMKSEEEETKIREATQAIKNVIKLFDNGRRHGHTKLVSQAAQDFPAHSKSLEANPRELAGIDSEIDAQSQSEDRAAARVQALSQQIGQEFSPNGMGTAASNVPNYAVISTRDSKDWKILAHVLATQLKGVLNHMEDREKENQYQKNRMQEEMMMMTQRQRMMGRDEDEDPDDEDVDDVDDDDDDNEKRRHSVLLPHLKKGSDNTSRINYLKHKQSQRLKSGRHITEQKLLHRAVKKLSRLEMLHKSQQKRQRVVHG